MPARISSGRPWLVVAATLMFSAAIDADALAASSFVDSKGRIRACVDRSGQMTILKKGRKRCKRGQELLAWRQRGTPAAGPTGPQGPAGGPGPQGDSGPKGDVGPSTGPAGGDLTGSFPNPTIAPGAVSLIHLGGPLAALLPTSAQRAALAGTSGSPGVANTYVTNSDARLTNSRAPSGTAAGDLAGSYPNPTLGTLPRVRAVQTAAQSFPASTFDPVRLDAAVTGATGASLDNPNDRIAISRSGNYLVATEVIWTTNGTGVRFLAINSANLGELVADARLAVPSIETVQTATTLVPLSAGDHITLTAAHTSGGNLSTTVFGGRAAALSVQWLGP